MAYVSFRVRREDLAGAPDVNPFGSYVRGIDTTAPAGLTRQDSDFALRADGFVNIVPELVVTAEFSATARSHNSVRLNWSQFSLSNPATNSVGNTEIQAIVVVYSPTGAPETVADGEVVKRQEYYDFTYAIDHEGLVAGKWAYYSLFLHWNQNGTGISGVNWYERVATLQELVPKNYGSIDALWTRIPRYYRENDYQGASYGHLRHLLEIFGFEMDRTRTLIDSVIAQYDPRVTETESIEQLASMLGLEVNIDDIGTSRIRQIIQDIGYYRQRKGTLDATRQYMTALSGCNVDVVESINNPKYTFRVYAERANLVADSLFVVTSATKKWNYSSNSASVSVTNTGDGLQVVNTGSSSAQFALISQIGVPVSASVNYWSSATMTASAGQMWGSQWATTSAAWSDWATEKQTNKMMPSNLSPVGRSVILMPDQEDALSKYPVMIFEINANATMNINKWMVEPRTYGTFFNGDSDFGGFLYQNNFADYQWSGIRYASYSTYTTNRQKVNNAIVRLLPKLLPITMLIDTSITYTILYDWIPNKT
jgi:hypothetical protein